MEMQSILIAGIIIMVGFLLGQVAGKFKMPKITGYIIAGIILNPQLFHFIPESMIEHTDLITNVSLSFISFSIGGTLLYATLKKLGKSILYITLLEAQLAFLMVFVVFLLASPHLLKIEGATYVTVFIPFSLLAAAMASPTDPTAALAISHEYEAKGEVTSTILSVSAFDDGLGIINYSFAVVIAAVLVAHQKVNLSSTLVQPFLEIIGSLVLGVVFGFLLNKITVFIQKEKEGVLIVVIFGMLCLCYGIATLFDVDQLLAIMTMGAIVVNYNIINEKIFHMIERYTEELIFVVFFTISGMQLDFTTLASTSVLILIYFVFRSLGKFTGTYLGATIGKTSENVKKYTAFGLIPLGGIVIGLALLIKQNPAFEGFSDLLLGLVLGSTVIHQIVGPLFAKMALRKAKEI